MARIIGGIACSHTPTIGFAVDTNKQNDAVWAPIFEQFAPIKQWIKDNQPDVLLYIMNDHVTSFFFDHYSAFCLGIDDHYDVADEGGGQRDLPSLKGHPELASHIGASLMADEFDMSFFQDKPLDHGCFSPLSMMCDFKPDWPVPLIPLVVGVLQFPIPTARRCYRMGQALRRAIESYPEDLKVGIVATGGLSHQVHGARCGFNNPEWDRQFVERFVNDPEGLTRMTIAEYAELGGVEGAEIIMWLIMRGALSQQVNKVHDSFYLPSMTNICTLILENQASPMSEREAEEHRAHMNHQLAGAENLPGTHPFTHARSRKGYRINKFLHSLIKPEVREAFLADEQGTMVRAGLSGEEVDMVLTRNWDALIRYGAIFFMLEKLGAVVGVSNLHIYAAMRGESLEQLMATRNAQALYSVAGKDKGKTSWDKN